MNVLSFFVDFHESKSPVDPSLDKTKSASLAFSNHLSWGDFATARLWLRGFTASNKHRDSIVAEFCHINMAVGPHRNTNGAIKLLGIFVATVCLDETSIHCKYLNTIVDFISHNNVVIRPNRYFTRHPKLAIIIAQPSKAVLQLPMFVKDLYAMVVGVTHKYLAF